MKDQWTAHATPWGGGYVAEASCGVVTLRTTKHNGWPMVYESRDKAQRIAEDLAQRATTHGVTYMPTYGYMTNDEVPRVAHYETQKARTDV